MDGKPRLLDRVQDRVRRKGYSIRTERAYAGWIRRYILFHGKRHPSDMGAPEVEAFLTHLAARFGIRSPRTCWNRATTSAPFRNCSGMRT